MSSMSVGVRVAQVRAQPSFLSPVHGELPYGSRVSVAELGGDWARISGGGITGWLHQTALSRGEIVLNPGAADVQRAVAGTEVSLAGRGFSASVEQAYRQRGGAANFAAVDRMEARVTGVDAAIRFARDGGLEPA
jgi:hypothetical protein